MVTAAQERYGLPPRYLLFVGTIEPRKNLSRLLAAFETIHADGLSDGLVIVGRPGWLYDSFFAVLEASPVRDAVVLPGYVTDEDLPAVYTGAQALVFPSLYEGFGLPVLEAMACGTPVVTSRASSIPEVGGDAALYFDPASVGEMGEAIRTMLGDSTTSEEKCERGLARAAQFSWQRVAAETWDVYDAVVNRGPGFGG
jgi:glycosyltransferase involved in cell wall biosynthesis